MNIKTSFCNNEHMKKLKREKARFKSKKIEIKNNVQRDRNFRILNENEFIIKEIKPDGNCFYCSLLYYFRDIEEDYNEFRILISEFIIQNSEKYIQIVSDDQVNIEENQKDNLNFINKHIKKYGENSKIDTNYEGDIEINTACLLLIFNIRIYVTGNVVYTLNNKFNNNIDDNSVFDNINILFINNNHFNLLIEKNNNKKENEFIKNITKK